MNFDNGGELEDWAEENGYSEAWNPYDEKVLIEKADSFVEFYLHKASDDTYARFTAYSSYYNGYYDIKLDKEGLKKVEKQVVVTKNEYI